MKAKMIRAALLTACLYLALALPVAATSGGGAGRTPSLEAAATGMVSDVYGFLVGASTAAAGIGVGCGAFMQKFSMGKQDKIEIGQRLMKNSVVGWGIFNGIGLILNFVGDYL